MPRISAWQEAEGSSVWGSENKTAKSKGRKKQKKRRKEESKKRKNIKVAINSGDSHNNWCCGRELSLSTNLPDAELSSQHGVALIPRTPRRAEAKNPILLQLGGIFEFVDEGTERQGTRHVHIAQGNTRRWEDCAPSRPGSHTGWLHRK